MCVIVRQARVIEQLFAERHPLEVLAGRGWNRRDRLLARGCIEVCRLSGHRRGSNEANQEQHKSTFPRGRSHGARHHRKGWAG